MTPQCRLANTTPSYGVTAEAGSLASERCESALAGRSLKHNEGVTIWLDDPDAWPDAAEAVAWPKRASE